MIFVYVFCSLPNVLSPWSVVDAAPQAAGEAEDHTNYKNRGRVLFCRFLSYLGIAWTIWDGGGVWLDNVSAMFVF